jgi:hypothetical protein
MAEKFVLRDRSDFIMEFESIPAKKGEPTRIVRAGYTRSALLWLQLRNVKVGEPVELSTQIYEGREIVVNGRTAVAKAMAEATQVFIELKKSEEMLKNLGI